MSNDIDTSTEAAAALTAGCGYEGHVGRLVRMVRALAAERDAERQRAEEAEAEWDELKAIIARMDQAVPLADQTCDEPGITLSEAVRRERAALREDEGGE